METRPKLKPELTVTDRFAESFSIFLLLLIWIMSLYYYSRLPEIIPTHFNAAGQPDAEGGKSTLFLLPVITTMLYAIMTIVNLFPHTFNFPGKITPETAMSQYTLATRMVRFIKVIMMLMFAVMTYMIIKTATGEVSGLGVLFLPIFVVATFIPMFIFIRKLKKVS